MSCSISDRHVFFGSTSRDAPADFFFSYHVYIYIVFQAPNSLFNVA